MQYRLSLGVVVGLAAICLFASVPLNASVAPHDGSTLSAATAAAPSVSQEKPKDNGDTIVYKTKTGAKYHKAGCDSLKKSSIPIKLRNAVAAGLGPCKNCRPPVLQTTK